MPSGIDMMLESIKEQLNEIKQQLSLSRKKGMDTKIIELRIASIPAKMKMAEITKNFKDVQKINYLIEAAKNDIANLENEEFNKK